MAIHRGDVFWLAPDDSRGPAPSYAHPHVVVQENVFNHSRITTVVEKLYSELAKDKDTSLDAASAGVFGLIESYARVFPAGMERGDGARRLLTALFPKSLEGATRPGYADELEEVKRILSAAKGPLAADVAAVPGLDEVLEVLEERAAEFAEVIRKEDTNAPSYAEAKEAAAAAERRMAELVNAILAFHHGDGPEAAARRAALLAPYETQQESMRQRFRRKLPVGDVDPATGEELEPDPADAGAELRAAREPAQ